MAHTILADGAYPKNPNWCIKLYPKLHKCVSKCVSQLSKLRITHVSNPRSATLVKRVPCGRCLVLLLSGLLSSYRACVPSVLIVHQVCVPKSISVDPALTAIHTIGTSGPRLLYTGLLLIQFCVVSTDLQHSFGPRACARDCVSCRVRTSTSPSACTVTLYGGRFPCSTTTSTSARARVSGGPSGSPRRWPFRCCADRPGVGIETGTEKERSTHESGDREREREGRAVCRRRGEGMRMGHTGSQQSSAVGNPRESHQISESESQGRYARAA